MWSFAPRPRSLPEFIPIDPDAQSPSPVSYRLNEWTQEGHSKRRIEGGGRPVRPRRWRRRGAELRALYPVSAQGIFLTNRVPIEWKRRVQPNT